jgi:hypothetical protein
MALEIAEKTAPAAASFQAATTGGVVACAGMAS